MTGVLVAISIPIFTSQLQKARLATNQSNARAAYAAATSAYLLDTASTKTTTYKYTTGDGQCVAEDGGGSAVVDQYNYNFTDISSWTTSTKVGGSTLGKTVYKTWTVTLNADTGAVTSYKANDAR